MFRTLSEEAFLVKPPALPEANRQVNKKPEISYLLSVIKKAHKQADVKPGESGYSGMVSWN